MSKRTIQMTDLFQLHSVTNPTLSPTGKAIVFLKTHIDEEANEYVTQLSHQDLETEVITQWTYGAQQISSPRWSPDGTHIAFLSNRDDKNQLYLMSTTGVEARQLTKLFQGVTQFLCSPCGEKIWLNALAKEGQPMVEEEKDAGTDSGNDDEI